jgi:drug/metabolite transporter (DMT)-like permease
VLVGSGLFALHFLIQITGLEYTTATNTGWIIAVAPVVLALMSRLLLGERITAGLAAGILVATAGIFVLVSGGRWTDLAWLGSPGDWLILVSAHTWALYTLAVRDLARSEDPLTVTIAVLLPATLGCVAVMAVRSDVSRFLEMPAEATIALVFLGVFGMALAQWFWQIGVARLGAARAGVFLYLEPLATTALAVPYLGEPFGLATLTGGSLVLLGVWIAQRL